MEKEAISDQFVIKATKKCEMDSLAFIGKNHEVIMALIAANRTVDALNLIFKQGFLSGMRFNTDMRDELVTKFK